MGNTTKIIQQQEPVERGFSPKPSGYLGTKGLSQPTWRLWSYELSSSWTCFEGPLRQKGPTESGPELVERPQQSLSLKEAAVRENLSKSASLHCTSLSLYFSCNSQCPPHLFPSLLSSDCQLWAPLLRKPS